MNRRNVECGLQRDFVLLIEIYHTCALMPVMARRRRKFLRIWGGVLRRKHVPECTSVTWFLCTTPPKSSKNFRLRRALPLGARDFCIKRPPNPPKTACCRHWGPSFRFAEPAPIGRSPAKRKNLVNPHALCGAVLFFTPAAGKTHF